MSRFDPCFDELPHILPVFPLAGVLLLPRGMLPLNIFEPRYLNMFEDALRGDRLIGMIQPSAPTDAPTAPPTGETGSAQTADGGAKIPALYDTGCAGRIVAFEETDDGRFLVTLKGISRFVVDQELAGTRGYRRVHPDWSDFADDMVEDQEDKALPRDRLIANLRPFFKLHEIDANWDALTETPDERLINSLAMICPFEPSEKQALLEAPTLADRAEVLTTLVEMAALDTGTGGSDNNCQ